MIVDRFNLLQFTCALNPFESEYEFTYIEYIVSNDGSCEHEVKRRISMARSAMNRLTRIWKDRSITDTVMMRFVRGMIFSILLYAVNTPNIRKKKDRRICVRGECSVFHGQHIKKINVEDHCRRSKYLN